MASKKKKAEMFEAFRLAKGGKPEEKSEAQPQPFSKPMDVKPPIPTPGLVKLPAAAPAGARPGGSKAIQPKLAEAKPVEQRPGAAKAVAPKPVPQKPVEAKAPKEGTLPSTTGQLLSRRPLAEGSVPSFGARPAEAKPVTPAPSAPPVQPAAARPVTPAPAAAVTAPTVQPAMPRPVTPTPGVTRPAPSVAPASAPRPAAASAAPARDMGKLKGSDDVHVVELGRKSEVIFGLSYQALILGVIGLAVVVIFAILIGSVIGGWARKPAGLKTPGKGLGVVEPSGKGVPAKGDTAVEGGTPSRTNPLPAGTYYCVQVLSVANTAERLRALDEDMEFLKTMRVAPLVKQVNLKGDRVSLFAGAFTREQKTDAEVLASRLRMMIFRNRKEFKDAQVVSVK